MNEVSIEWMFLAWTSALSKMPLHLLGTNADFKISLSFWLSILVSVAVAVWFCEGIWAFAELGCFQNCRFWSVEEESGGFGGGCCCCCCCCCVLACKNLKTFGGVPFVSVSICVFAEMGCFQSCSLWSVEEESGDFVGCCFGCLLVCKNLKTWVLFVLSLWAWGFLSCLPFFWF